ncbi:AAEL015370-PA [Aedes aegypti]|uniref:AAEL015370-PA n=1 Tax=Aedes aegypti TaxID=7159 RepID=Q16E69_AEDAE|nr:AAEL015370-PA [Aedes aegypti]
MDWLTIVLLLILALLVLYEVHLRLLPSNRAAKQFPGPRRLPVLGNALALLFNDQVSTFMLLDAGPNATRSPIETAMGVKLDSMSMADEYRAKIQEVIKLLLLRVMNPWLVEEFPYRLLGFRRRLMKVLKPIHAFTRSIIKQRRDLFHANVKNVDDFSEENIYVNTNQRYALLDTLLASEAKNQIDEEGIREEVDTFMFEGHDTTASAFTFIFLVIANHQEAQRQLVEEIEAMIAGRIKPTEPLSMHDYSELKFMDRVIKECLRLYPPVPFISRAILEDALLGDRFIPKDSMANLHIFDLHRDPDQFPDPERFDPDRFLPANVEKRNPYAYVPFSAGPRNCIGELGVEP